MSRIVQIRGQVPQWLERAAALGWRLLVVGAAVYYGGLIIAELRIVTVSLVLGLFVAALLTPVRRLSERIMPTSLATVVSLGTAMLVLAGVVTLLGFGIAGQAQPMGDAAARGWSQLVQLAEHSPVAQWTQSHGLVSSLSEEVQSRAGGVASELAAGAGTLAMFVSQLLLTIVFAFFFVRDGQRMFDHLVGRLQPANQKRTRRAGNRAWGTLSRYLRGLALIASCNALLTGLALVLIDVPLVGSIMVLTFIGSFIPFAGPIVAGSVAALVALADGGLIDAALVVGAALCVQGIEGNVLQPYVLGRTMRLHPVLILAGVTVGTILAGLAGAFLAVPVLAVVVKVVPELFDSGAEAVETLPDGHPDYRRRESPEEYREE